MRDHCGYVSRNIESKGIRDSIQKEPAHADGKENLGMLPLGEIFLEVSELFSKATLAALCQGGLLGDIW